MRNSINSQARHVALTRIWNTDTSQHG